MERDTIGSFNKILLFISFLLLTACQTPNGSNHQLTSQEKSRAISLPGTSLYGFLTKQDKRWIFSDMSLSPKKRVFG